MKAFVKTLFGDARNVAGVTLIVAIAVVLTAIGHAPCAVIVMPLASLAVIAMLAAH
jgi:hypothetical protein